MPLDIFDAVDPATLTEYVRGYTDRNAAAPYLFDTILPSQSVDDIDYSFDKGGSGLIDAAMYRAYDAEAQIGERRGRTKVRGQLPPISRKLPMTEYQRLKFRRIQDADMGGTVIDDAEDLTGTVLDRVELARYEALYTGEVNLSENGLTFQVDYGRDNTHNASASVSWSTAVSADPVKDFVDCAELIRDAGGEPTHIIMNHVTFAKMKATDSLKAAATGTSSVTDVVPNSLIAAILAEFGLPGITVYNKRTQVAGSATKFVPDDQVIIVDASNAGNRNGIGSTPYGLTAEQLEYAADGSVQGGGLFAMSWKIPDPVAVWTKVSAITLPVLTNPDLSVGLDVS